MTCETLDSLLCDYSDGTLPSESRLLVEEHLAVCPACAELAQAASGTLAFFERIAPVEPPPELITRIVVEARAQASPRRSWWRRWFGPVLEPVLQPRFAMSMALTILSFSMLGKITGLPTKQLKPSDLDPVKVWATLDDKAHRTWSQAVKYYESLKVVYEVQSRLKEWSEQEQDQQPAAAPRGAVAPASRPGEKAK